MIQADHRLLSDNNPIFLQENSICCGIRGSRNEGPSGLEQRSHHGELALRRRGRNTSPVRGDEVECWR